MRRSRPPSANSLPVDGELRLPGRGGGVPGRRLPGRPGSGVDQRLAGPGNRSGTAGPGVDPLAPAARGGRGRARPLVRAVLRLARGPGVLGAARLGGPGRVDWRAGLGVLGLVGTMAGCRRSSGRAPGPGRSLLGRVAPWGPRSGSTPRLVGGRAVRGLVGSGLAHGARPGRRPRAECPGAPGPGRWPSAAPLTARRVRRRDLGAPPRPGRGLGAGRPLGPGTGRVRGTRAAAGAGREGEPSPGGGRRTSLTWTRLSASWSSPPRGRAAAVGRR